jgi:hypothetical protein
MRRCFCASAPPRDWYCVAAEGRFPSRSPRWYPPSDKRIGSGGFTLSRVDYHQAIPDDLTEKQAAAALARIKQLLHKVAPD